MNSFNYQRSQDIEFPSPCKVLSSCSLLYNFLCPKCHYFLCPTHSAKPRSNFLSFLELCSVSSTKVSGSFFVLLKQRVKVLAQHSKSSKEDGFSHQPWVRGTVTHPLSDHCFSICKRGHPWTIPISTTCNPVSLTPEVALDRCLSVYLHSHPSSISLLEI